MSKVAWSVLLVCLALVTPSLADSAEAGFNFTYGYKTAANTVSAVDYSDEAGTSLRGFFVYDNTTTSTRPVVVIAPDYDGTGPYEMWRANLLATMGYAAFVADIYGTDQLQGPALSQTNSSHLAMQYISDPETLLMRIGAAVQEAQRQPHVRANSTAVIGYCFGGATVLDLAASYPDSITDNVLGVMAFHTGAPPSPMLNQTEGNPIRISVQQGWNDQSVSHDEAAMTQQMWEDAGITWEWTWYSGTVHAFTEPDLVGSSASASSAYNQVADERSWQALRFFLLDLFGYTSTANPYTNTTVFDTTSSFA